MVCSTSKLPPTSSVIDALCLPVVDLEAPGVVATIESYRRDPDFVRSRRPVVVSVHGPLAKHGARWKADKERCAAYLLGPRAVCKCLTERILPNGSFSPEERATLLHALDLAHCRQECPPAGDGAVPNALVGKASAFLGGANRNRLALITAGLRTVITDDDEPRSFTAWRSPEKDSWIRLSAAGDPNEIRPFPSEEAIDAAYDWEALPINRIHGAYLGREVDPRSAGEEALLLSQIGPGTEALVEAIIEAPPIVRITTAGYVGAGGAGMYQRLLSLEGEERERFVGNRDRFFELLYSGLWATFPQQSILADDRFFRSGHAGYDNRIPLPPFPPCGRGEDVAWGAVAGYVLPPGSKMHLPVALRHRRQPKPAKSKDDLVLLGPRLNDLLYAVVPQNIARVSSPAGISGALESLGSRLTGIADSARDHPGRFLDSYLVDYLQRRIRHYEALLDRYDRSPSWWCDSLETVMDADKYRLANKEARRLVDIPPDRPDMAVDHLFRYGRLLTVWPRVHRLALELELSDWVQ